MKTCFLTLIFIACSYFIQAKINSDTTFIEGKNYMIYRSAMSGTKIKSKDLLSMISPFERGVFFFYPEIDSAKRVNYDYQIKELAEGPRFKDAKVIGIPFVEAKTDEDNIWLDSYIITGIQCMIYTKDDKDLVRALSLNSEIIRDQKGLPVNFSRIDVNKEELCVKENRIIFFEKVIDEFLSPQLSKDEKIDIMIQQQKLLLDQVSSQSTKISNLEKEIKELKEQIESQVNYSGKKQ